MNVAVMNVEKGEDIVASLVGGLIAGTGRYKMLAKKKLNGNIEWAHFLERDTGIKESVYRGQVRNDTELQILITVMNKNLKKVFGDQAIMRQGTFEITTIMGQAVLD
jgi:hypothetical protein